MYRLKKILILVIILTLLSFIFIPVNADELKQMNIKVTEYPERTVTISQEFDLTAKVLVVEEGAKFDGKSFMGKKPEEEKVKNEE